MDTHTDSVRWWGERTLAEGERLHGRLGTLELWLERGPREWLATTRHGDDEARTPRLEQPWEGTVPEHDEQTIFAERFAFRRTGDRLQLLPAMPPRPVVVHTATPLVIPGGEEATVYISLPLWLRASAGGELLLDVPVVRQSDTWFGAITGPGELCYASRSRGRLRLEDLPATPCGRAPRSTCATRRRARSPSMACVCPRPSSRSTPTGPGSSGRSPSSWITSRRARWPRWTTARARRGRPPARSAWPVPGTRPSGAPSFTPSAA